MTKEELIVLAEDFKRKQIASEAISLSKATGYSSYDYFVANATPEQIVEWDVNLRKAISEHIDAECKYQEAIKEFIDGK